MKTEPTAETNEKSIQHLMDRLFTCEMPDDSSNNVSADEQFAIDAFKSNLKFEDGAYWIKPSFKKDYVPMLNNYNVALRRYKSLEAIEQRSNFGKVVCKGNGKID